MLHIYTVNPETMRVSKELSHADTRGVGENEIVSPNELSIEEIRAYCNEQWAGPYRDDAGHSQGDWDSLEWAAE